MNEILYRIIDANFNRSREALRVMEEYCRFFLNSSALSTEAKQSRHELCQSLKKIDPLKLLSNRDTFGDVGRELKVDNQLKRQSLEDCFTAAAKRASEALRALAESTQAIDPNISTVMENIRFKVYDIEKKAVLKSFTKAKFEPVRLYLLINATPQTKEQQILDFAKACLNNGADCLQLRAKNICDASLLALAVKFTALCKEANAISIINDRTDIAILSNADGVHLGQDEIPVTCAKQLARRPLIVGVSTHNLKELHQAVDSECDYVGIGPAFHSPTKPNLEVSGLDYIRQAIPVLEKAGIPHIAIGGINLQNMSELLKNGVRAIAVSSVVSESTSPETICESLKNTLLNGLM